MDQRAFASATRLAGEIRDRRIGCLELLDFFVARAEQYNPALNAVVAWQVDGRASAPPPMPAGARRGVGPLHGIPMTVKESFNVAGLPSTQGNPPWRDNIAATTRCWSIGCWPPAQSSMARPTCRMLEMPRATTGLRHDQQPVGQGTRRGGSSGGEAAALAAGLSAWRRRRHRRIVA
jgi:amidase